MENSVGDINAKTDSGKTLLMVARIKGNTSIGKLLKAAGARE